MIIGLIAAFIFALALHRWANTDSETQVEDPILYLPKVEPEADRFTRRLRQPV